VFIKDGREADGPPIAHAGGATPSSVASTVQDEHVAASGLLRRVVARTRGH
jgi:hypothetical protein